MNRINVKIAFRTFFGDNTGLDETEVLTHSFINCNIYWGIERGVLINGVYQPDTRFTAVPGF